MDLSATVAQAVLDVVDGLCAQAEEPSEKEMVNDLADQSSRVVNLLDLAADDDKFTSEIREREAEITRLQAEVDDRRRALEWTINEQKKITRELVNMLPLNKATIFGKFVVVNNGNSVTVTPLA